MVGVLLMCSNCSLTSPLLVHISFQTCPHLHPPPSVYWQLGLKKQDVIDVVALGAIASPMFALKGPAMAKGSYPPGGCVCFAGVGE